MAEKHILKIIILLTLMFSMLVIAFSIYTNKFIPVPKPVVTNNGIVTSLSPDLKTSLVTEILKININTATKEELTVIPGIGDVIAQNIIDYRTENGDFKSIEELLNVSKIGNKTLQNIKDYIQLNTVTYENN